MKNVLLVDDEKIFLMSLTEGLRSYASDFSVLTAANGREALEILNSTPIDLVVTDLKMPEMDGFELLAHMNREHLGMPIIVMTAFGTPDIEEQTAELGAIQYLEKPLGFVELADKIFDGLAAGTRGHISGISVSMFLQLVAMESKTCTLTIRAGDRQGSLYILKGELLDAELEGRTGREAAMQLVCWTETEIEISNTCRRKKNQINAPISFILMEGARLQDEHEENGPAAAAETDTKPLETKEELADPVQSTQMEVNIMAVQDKLKEFAAITGFAGVALFTPKGEALAVLESNVANLNVQKVGVLANNVLLNAQKAALDMGAGRGQLVHIVAEKAHIIVRCLNEGLDAVKTEAGKAHIHLVLVLTDDTSIGLAKMKVESVIESLASDFRA